MELWTKCRGWFRRVEQKLGSANPNNGRLYDNDDFWSPTKDPCAPRLLVSGMWTEEVLLQRQKVCRYVSELHVLHQFKPITRISVKMHATRDIFLAGVVVEMTEENKTKRNYFSRPQRNSSVSDALEFAVDQKCWRTNADSLLFDEHCELPHTTGEIRVGIYYCTYEPDDSFLEFVNASKKKKSTEKASKIYFTADLIVFGLGCQLEEKIENHKVPMVSRLIPGSTKHEQNTFVGHTLNGKLIWKENANETVTVALPSGLTNVIHYHWNSDDVRSIIGDSGIMYKLDFFDHTWSEDVEINQEISRAFKSLLVKLESTKIRSIPLLEVFWALADRKDIGYPLSVVGGAVRDILREKPSNDIDIAVGGHYKELEDHLRDYFVSKGESVSKNTLFTKPKSKQYGQLKIMPIEKEKEPLDVALFKVKRIEETNLDAKGEVEQDHTDIKLYHDAKEKVHSKYLFGYSYDLDAKQRDWTVNALYFQLFPFPALIDPTGHGFADLKKDKLSLASSDEFEKDFGGQLRFWKMKYSNEFREVDKNTPPQVNQYLLKRVGDLNTSEKFVEFFKKLRSKLFKANGALEKFHARMKVEVFKDSKNWWLEFINKVRDFTYPKEEQLDTQLMIMIEEIRELSAVYQ